MTGHKLILLLSGKRKSGKDFVGELLLKKIGCDQSEIIRISEPIKKHWANHKSLNLSDLLSDGPYKEQYRKEMIEWSDEVRGKNSSFFCSEAFKTATKPIIIVSDIRRKTDIAFFKSLNIPLITVRIESSDEIRRKRGWIFQSGIDDVASECDLDNYLNFDCCIQNDGNNLNLQILKEHLQKYIFDIDL